MIRLTSTAALLPTGQFWRSWQPIRKMPVAPRRSPIHPEREVGGRAGPIIRGDAIAAPLPSRLSAIVRRADKSLWHYPSSFQAVTRVGRSDALPMMPRTPTRIALKLRLLRHREFLVVAVVKHQERIGHSARQRYSQTPRSSLVNTSHSTYGVYENDSNASSCARDPF